MEWSIDRAWKKDTYTISRVFLDGKRFGDGRKYCNCLEDTDRGLTKDMPLAKIKQIKVKGKTAIPSGTYEIVMTYSPRFGKDMPLLVLFGVNDRVGWISNSKYWTTMITGIIKAAIKRGEKVTIKVG